jgi:glycosyltransferase involved in cell wall biosynthesis
MDIGRSKLRSLVTNVFLFVRFRKKQNKFDQIVFFDTVINPGVLKSASREVKYGLVLDSTTAQWLINTEWGVKTSSKTKKRRMHYEHKVLQEFDMFFALSSAVSNSLQNDFGINFRKVVRVRTGTGQLLSEIVHPKNPYNKKEIRLLTVAKGEHWRKGIDVLFQSLLLDRDHLIVSTDALLGTNFNLNLPKFINRYSFVSTSKLLKLYKSADIFILPCRFEPYGLVFVEAIQMGLPIITTANSGLGKEFLDAGWPGLIVDLNPDSILNGIRTLTSIQTHNEEETVKLQKSILESFTWNSLASAIVNS